MICPVCEKHNKEIEMEVVEVVKDFHNPSDRFGHGQYTFQVLVCPKCDHEEECEPDINY